MSKTMWVASTLFILLVVIIISSVAFPLPIIAGSPFKENFSNYTLAEAGEYPKSDVLPLVSTSYPYTGRHTVSDNTASDVWWYYPIFTEGSYAQITNNLKYQRNPDNGTCVDSEFCGVLYKDNQQASNITLPLPPVGNGEGVRVGYFRTPENLFLGPQPGPQLELPAF